MGKKSEFYIVWNETRTEGFITNDENDACMASSGWSPNMAVSSTAQAFYDAYSEDGDLEIELPVQTIKLTPPAALERSHDGG